MKKYLVLPRIAAIAFAMLPVGIAFKSTTWIVTVMVLTLLPLVVYLMAAVRLSRLNHATLLTNLLRGKPNFFDVLIAALGMANCFFFGLYTLSIIWVVLLACVLLEMWMFPKGPKQKRE